MNNTELRGIEELVQGIVNCYTTYQGNDPKINKTDAIRQINALISKARVDERMAVQEELLSIKHNALAHDPFEIMIISNKNRLKELEGIL